jgi:hypothetical protein
MVSKFDDFIITRAKSISAIVIAGLSMRKDRVVRWSLTCPKISSIADGFDLAWSVTLIQELNDASDMAWYGDAAMGEACPPKK